MKQPVIIGCIVLSLLLGVWYVLILPAQKSTVRKDCSHAAKQLATVRVDSVSQSTSFDNEAYSKAYAVCLHDHGQ